MSVNLTRLLIPARLHAKGACETCTVRLVRWRSVCYMYRVCYGTPGVRAFFADWKCDCLREIGVSHHASCCGIIGSRIIHSTIASNCIPAPQKFSTSKDQGNKSRRWTSDQSNHVVQRQIEQATALFTEKKNGDNRERFFCAGRLHISHGHWRWVYCQRVYSLYNSTLMSKLALMKDGRRSQRKHCHMTFLSHPLTIM